MMPQVVDMTSHLKVFICLNQYIWNWSLAKSNRTIQWKNEHNYPWGSINMLEQIWNLLLVIEKNYGSIKILIHELLNVIMMVAII